jgi:hypothetical protein
VLFRFPNLISAPHVAATRMSRWRKTSIWLYIARPAMRVNGETLAIRRERRQYVLEREWRGRWESNPSEVSRKTPVAAPTRHSSLLQPAAHATALRNAGGSWDALA